MANKKRIMKGKKKKKNSQKTNDSDDDEFDYGKSEIIQNNDFTDKG